MKDTPFFRRPPIRFYLGILIGLIAYFTVLALAGGWQENLRSVILDALLCLIGLVTWPIFFAQFILPVRRIGERAHLLERLMLYIQEFLSFGLLNLHGPAIFIENGKIIQRDADEEGGKESQEKGPGVIWLDTASAAVLRNSTRFTRTVGPGITFTSWHEYLAGTVDLHIQKLGVGPTAENDNPFGPRTDELSKEKFEEIQERIRWSTSGMTRDGIEVVPEITILFKIDADDKAREGGTCFGYNEQAVFKAVSHEGINPGLRRDNPRFKVSWNEIPGPLAVDLWREHLRKFTLTQLFETLPANYGQQFANQTALQFIAKRINERLQNANAINLDDFGRPTGGASPSREYQLISASGIRILIVSLKRLFFSPAVEEQLVRQWSASWLDTARREREQVEQRRSLETLTGVEDARREFAELASQEIARQSPQERRAALEMLLQDTLKGVIRNTSLYRRLSSEPREITEIIQWLRDNA
jgi:hypothetical protein